MARHRKKSRRQPSDSGPAVAVASESAAAGDESAASPSPPASRKWLVLMAALVAVWIVCLVLLAVSAAGHVMLNRTQILQSDLIVTGRVVDLEAGTIAVDAVWKSDGTIQSHTDDSPLTVRRLTDSNARPGQTYLLPLTRVRGDTYEITRPPLLQDRAGEDKMNRPPPIYRATGKAIEQLQDLLAD